MDGLHTHEMMLNIANYVSQNQIKSTIKCHLYLSEWPSLKCLQRTNGQEGVEKRNPPMLLMGMWIGELTMENGMEVA